MQLTPTQPHRVGRQWLLLVLVATLSHPTGQAEEPDLVLTPAESILRGPEARQRLLVTLESAAPEPHGKLDVCRQVEFRTDTPDVLAVDAQGVVKPVGEGLGTVIASKDGKETRARVLVAELSHPRAVSFALEVEPVLARAGCSSGPCHGKARGQNGFQLSLLGFDAELDHRALTRDLSGRRVLTIDPEQSLMLLKGAAILPHGGGKRLETSSPLYGTLRRWIEEGALPQAPGEPTLVDLEVEPPRRALPPGGWQQVAVAARYSDGTRRDVTHLATFLSSESALAAVDEHGLVHAGELPGEAIILARFLGRVATLQVVLPMAGKMPPQLYAELPRKNFIDDLVWRKLETLGITPSPPAPETTFHRRVFIDTIGRLPTPEETRSFLADSRPDKRERLVDRLLDRPEYADHWANKWVDLLRPNPYRVGIKAVFNFDGWIRAAFRRNQPFDQFVREILTARGSTFEPGAATLYRDRRSPDEVMPMLSQLFLGIRLECARCHHHPFESYGQDEFYSLAAYFARVGYKGNGLSPPISGSEELVFAAASGVVKHPLTGAVLEPRPLFGKVAASAERDPREAFATWVLDPDNPYFARTSVNRVWAELMGIGLVEPVDDLRPTNPPSNAELLDALAADFRAGGFNLKQLLRRIMTSQVYGLASTPTSRNAADTRGYSRYYRQRLRAEVVVDAVSDITAVAERFDALPPGSRAQEIWTHRTESISLDAFGRPDPNQDPPCQRTADTSLVQALHLMNSRRFHEKVTSDAGRAQRLAASEKSSQEVVDELYLLVYARLPSAAERAVALKDFQQTNASRRQACEDLLWALLNTPEFLFKD